MKIPILHFDDVADGEPPAPPPGGSCADARLDLAPVRAAQKRWAAVPLARRLRLLRTLRGALAADAPRFVRALQPRDEAHAAEMLATQIIPLADALRFLEREAGRILAPRTVGRRGRPAWLAGTVAEVRREPIGVMLVVAPSNYPLFLAGVVTVQALAGGNAVLLKPGPGGSAAAREMAAALHDAGLDPALLTVLDEAPSAAVRCLEAGVDKLIFTGGARAGADLLAQCAPRLVPSVMELSGVDAFVVRADADVAVAARALVFGLRLNRGATCIAPRRVLVHETRLAEFEAECLKVLAVEPPWQVPAFRGGARAASLVVDAAARGARVIAGEVDHHGHLTAPLLVSDARPDMPLLREDHFAAVAAIVAVRDDEQALEFDASCPYALGAAIFSRDEVAARALASRWNAGTVVLNDVIAPTADPRLPFGGRRNSGFGLTRGPEGLLEMTRPKVISRRSGSWRPHYEPPQPDDMELFSHFLLLTHAPRWSTRWKSALGLLRLALKRRNT